MLLMIDNYDSFTYHLVQYLGELGEDVRVYRNDKITVDEIAALKPQRMVISPGPCTPNEAGVSVAAIQRFAGHGVTGAAGTLLTAVVLSPSLGGTGYGPGMDLAHQMVGQAIGVAAVAAWSAIATAIAALMVSMALPMRVTREDELAGLDSASHGENAFEPD